MKINLEEMVGNWVCIHCDTEEKCITFLRAMEANGIKWSSGKDATSSVYFKDYRENTVYTVKYGCLTYADVKYFERNGYDILEFDDYEWENFVQFDESAVNVDDFMVGLFE